MTTQRPSIGDHPVRRALSSWLSTYARTGPLLVAVSGGADSLALAAALIVVAADRDPVAVTVDHGLQDGSAAQAQACADQLRGLGFRRVEVRTVTVDGAGGPEAAARTARYRALTQRSAEYGSAPVLLGHTLDDQAETVLLGLGRGSGPRSIAGMRAWRAPWGRPLLGIRRAETEKSCAAAGLRPWTDPHNADPTFTRVQLRTEVLPLLERVLGGGVAGALARTAALQADDLEALDAVADRARSAAGSADGRTLDRVVLLDWPPAVRRRAVRSWLAGQQILGLTADHLHRADELLVDGRNGSAVRLPGGRDLTRRGDRLRLEPADAAESGQLPR